MKHHAFISYADSDARAARQFCAALLRYRIPVGLAHRTYAPSKPSRFNVYLPSSSGNGTSEDDLAELQQSEYLILVCSPQCAKDPYVDSLLRAFKRLGRPHNILTLILDGEPNVAEGRSPSSHAEECFPDALKYDLGSDGQVDLSRRFEPIAADGRPHHDSDQVVCLKLAAGLLGVGFDDLYHREQRRQRRQLRSVVIASLLVTVLLGILTVRAFLSGEESRNQLRNTRQVNSYIEALFADIDRSALQKMDPKLMSLILDASERDLDQDKPPPPPDLEAQMRQVLGQAYLACGLWNKAIANLQRSLVLWEPILGDDGPSVVISRRDLGEALIGAGKAQDAKVVLLQTPPSGNTVVRYELARALALTGDDPGAEKLLSQEISVRPQAYAQAVRDPVFNSIRPYLIGLKPGAPQSH